MTVEGMVVSNQAGVSLLLSKLMSDTGIKAVAGQSSDGQFSWMAGEASELDGETLAAVMADALSDPTHHENAVPICDISEWSDTAEAIADVVSETGERHRGNGLRDLYAHRVGERHASYVRESAPPQAVPPISPNPYIAFGPTVEQALVQPRRHGSHRPR